ncbi:MAG: dTDP-4-dehydrorhamnose 3,5-epimerase family protein [Actinomycetota bacterium]
MSEPMLLTGGVAVDDRGSVSFVNDFDFAGVKRFYIVDNHRKGFIRAWHAHRHEAKYVVVVKGSALVAAVEIDDWDNPSKDLKIHRHVLSERAPKVLAIPAGYANGFMSLTDDARLMFLSTATLEDSLDDDVRWESRYWDPWTVEER